MIQKSLKKPLWNILRTQKLYAEYNQLNCPLLLPKIAKHIFHSKITSILASFLTKIKLNDLLILTKESMIIKIIKLKKRFTT